MTSSAVGLVLSRIISHPSDSNWWCASRASCAGRRCCCDADRTLSKTYRRKATVARACTVWRQGLARRRLVLASLAVHLEQRRRPRQIDEAEQRGPRELWTRLSAAVATKHAGWSIHRHAAGYVRFERGGYDHLVLAADANPTPRGASYDLPWDVRCVTRPSSCRCSRTRDRIAFGTCHPRGVETQVTALSRTDVGFGQASQISLAVSHSHLPRPLGGGTVKGVNQTLRKGAEDVLLELEVVRASNRNDAARDGTPRANRKPA